MIKVILVLFSHLVITFCAEWTDAQWSDYPFMVRLDIEKNGARYICGGSIISTSECKWGGRGVILTAAHCVSGATNVNVGIGCTQTSCTDSGAKYYNDDYYVIHPSYNPSLPTWDPNWFNDDIALIYLSEPITNTNARKIRLHSDINVLNNNDNIRVFGYYGDCSGNPSCIGGSDVDSLEYADTHYMIATECDDTWGTHVTGPHDFCTKDDDASNGLQSICGGDSGSPLLFQNKQMGLNSWGASSCNPNLPGVATSIPHYYQWITSQAQQQCVDGLLPKGKYFRLQNRHSKSCIYQNSDGRFWHHLCGY